nr:MAG TPA: hypothetical protein [Caudoviricetes sp.]
MSAVKASMDFCRNWERLNPLALQYSSMRAKSSGLMRTLKFS